MKNTSPFFLIIIMLFFSCSNNEEIELPVMLQDNSCPCDDLDPNDSATWCCVKRNTILDINSIVEYEYTTNLNNSIFGWEVYGDVEVVSGIDSNVIRIIFKENFESATLKGFSSDGVNIGCTNTVIIAPEVLSVHN